MLKSYYEVILIKKSVTILICLLILSALFPLKANAADMNSYVGAVTTGGGNLYVRKSASTGSAVLASLKKGSYITLISKSGSWWKVEYAADRYGYCHTNYITPVEGKPMTVNTGGNVLNVRSGPGTGYSRIATVSHGSVVLVRSSANGWSKIIYHGTQQGYVSTQYLVGQASSQATYAPISLKVPSFKQTDRRWSGYPIGTAGGTIGTIGCATTGIAMMESYRTGSTIYPNQMAQKLSYSSGGSVYWPSHYQITTSSSDYLSAIYKLLQQGKPVLIGAKTSRGGQHWVVITGFTGGNTLSPDSFTINDPGSSSRTNLKQFFNAYPNFYKFFHW